MSDDQRQIFLESFDTAATAIRIDGIAISEAKRALSELWETYSPRANNSTNLAPFFADHGKAHPLRLARKCSELFQSDFISKESVYPHLNAQALLLAYASFLFHDIGMCIPPEDSILYFDELAKSQGVRERHDERSLEFIENELVRKYQDFVNWNAFWGNAGCAGMMPTPEGKIAFLLLARICKSHGDIDSVWLKDGSLDFYNYRTSGEVIKFETYWNADWETYKPTIYTAATILCLCDLCDINSDRFEMLPADLSSLLPGSAEARKWSLIHHISHQVGEVSFNKGNIVINVHGQSEKLWSYISLQYCGAISDLLQWGRKIALVNRIKLHLNPDYSDVLIRRSTNDDKQWKKIIEYLESKEFKDCFPFHAINFEFEPQLGSDSYFLSWVFLGISKSIHDDLSENAGEVEYDFYISVLLMLKSGLLIESSVSFGTIGNANIYDFNLPDVSKSYETKVSRFIAGLSLAKNLIAEIERYMAVRMVSFSSSLMADLKHGYVSKFKDSILLIDIRNEQTNDHDTYASLSELHHKLELNNVYLIFVGNGFSDYFSDNADRASNVQVKYNHKVIEALVGNQKNSIRTASPSSLLIEPPSGGKSVGGICSPGDAVATLWCRGAGYVEFITQIRKQIDDSKTSRAMSILALLTLSECLAIKNGPNDSVITVSVSRLEQAYQRFKVRFPSDAFSSFESSLELLPNEFIDMATGIVSLPSAVLKNLDSNRIEINKQSWFQSYVGAILLQSEDYFNPLARVLHSNTISFDHAKKYLLLLDNDSDFSNKEKVVLGTALGEFLGRQLCRDGFSFSWISSLFNSRIFSNELKQCLHFQMVYRIARRFLDTGGLVTEGEIPNSPAARLGLLEAVCRQSETDRALSASSELLINSIIERATAARHKLEKMVVFDILWKYCKDFYMDYEKLTVFVNHCKSLSWHEVADEFHKQPSNGAELLKIKVRVKEWSEFRKLFYFILENTPNELRRSKA